MIKSVVENIIGGGNQEEIRTKLISILESYGVLHAESPTPRVTSTPEKELYAPDPQQAPRSD